MRGSGCKKALPAMFNAGISKAGIEKMQAAIVSNYGCSKAAGDSKVTTIKCSSAEIVNACIWA